MLPSPLLKGVLIILLTDKLELVNLSFGSKKLITIKCDYCDNIFNKEYRRYLEHGHFNKDYCKKCIKIKNVEEFLIKLNSSQTNEITKYMNDINDTSLSGVYSVVNKVNNKSYIGSSKNIISRWKNHIEEINKGTHYCNELNYIELNQLDFIVLHYPVDVKDLIELEYNYINLFNTKNPEFGYNIMSKRKKSTIKTGRRFELIEKLQKSKLNLSEVESIKRELYKGTSMKVLSKQYGINYSTVQSIKRCSIWKEVLPELNDQLKSLVYKDSYKGESNGCSKLTEVQVKEIKSLLSIKNMTMTDIGKKYGVSRTLIGHIKSGKLWSHVV